VTTIIFKICKIFIFSKWIFNKPNKKKVLIYDRESEDFWQVFFSKNICANLDVRYESINIYVFLYTLFNSGIENFIDNYKKNYIKFVSPKIVFTAIDNNTAFYNLKNIYDKPFYVSVQNGMRDNVFYDQCKRYIKEKKKELKADHIFVFSNSEKKRFSKIIKAKIHCVGNVKNNSYPTQRIKKEKKIKLIMFVTTNSEKDYKDADYRIEEDKKLFNLLYKFCKKKGVQLGLCSKLNSSQEIFFRNSFAKGNWVYYPQFNTRKTYELINKQQMIVFDWSTLGFEALAKGLKCVAFYKDFPLEGHYVKYPKSGFFWTNSKNYNDLEKTLNRVIKSSNKRWKKVVDKYSSELINYDANNIKSKKILNNLLKKNKIQN